MPRIIKNDTDSYIMKNGVAYGDGLTGYVLKDGMYYGYMSNPAGSSSGGISRWRWNDLPDDNYKKYSIGSDNYNILHLMIYSESSTTLTRELTPVHIVMSAEVYNNSNIDNPIVCTFWMSGAGTRSFYMYKDLPGSVAVRRGGDTEGIDGVLIHFYGENV